MKSRNLTIKFNDLPVRTDRISPKNISKIFGGCIVAGERCSRNTFGIVCCPGLDCREGSVTGFKICME